ncbi:MAG: sporulation transcriptional regulator SpoIIID [Clostridia bacterium]|nr:sporulation transcriptional regulator SpoIIID [Clostridia bacterium]
MDNITEMRAVMLAKYIISTNSTVRQCAKAHAVSKSTVHTDVTKRLGGIDKNLLKEVRRVLDKNKEERHLRGGMATREKYLKNQK